MDYTPLNRHEQYLNAIRTGDTTNLPQPINREETYLYDIAMNGGGGGGGATDAVKYTEQSLTAEQQTQARTNIGAANAADVPTAEQQAAWSAKQDALTFDSAPTQNSTNPVTSDGIYSALQSAGVQSDWAQNNSSEPDFIKNKPPIRNGHGTGGNLEGGTSGYATYSNSIGYGVNANANGDYAFAFGYGVNANHNQEVAFGKFNVSNADTAFSIGDGSGSGATPNHNLMELKTNGSLLLNGNAVQTKNLATPLSISGTSQNTVESALGAISKKTSLLADINRNLGTEITAAQKLAIATGTFEDLPIGAYWALNGTVYRIVHHDYYLGAGDTECTSHHIVVVPDNNMYNAVMNDANTTTGGYANSKMRTTNLATALSTFETDFGVAHILNHRILVTNAVSDGQASGWAWVDSKVDLMSENMVLGHPVWGKAGNETGMERSQLALFSLYPEYIQKQRLWYWLRSVASGSGFCFVAGDGGTGGYGASGSAGVRPYACIYFDDVL